MTARIAGAKPDDTHPPALSSSRPPSNSDLPYGSPVAGKPGFITSPYAPDAIANRFADFTKLLRVSGTALTQRAGKSAKYLRNIYAS
jgi:hypothetical protein